MWTPRPALILVASLVIGWVGIDRATATPDRLLLPNHEWVVGEVFEDINTFSGREAVGGGGFSGRWSDAHIGFYGDEPPVLIEVFYVDEDPPEVPVHFRFDQRPPVHVDVTVGCVRLLLSGEELDPTVELRNWMSSLVRLHIHRWMWGTRPQDPCPPGVEYPERKAVRSPPGG